MDKNRIGLGPKRPHKSRAPAPFDLIPLGTKVREGEQSGAKLAAAVKREAQHSPIGSLLSKVPKYGSPRSESPSSKSHYDEIAIDYGSPSELLDRVQAEGEDNETTDKLVCGAVKYLRQQRAKPNQQLLLTLIYLVKSHPDIFNTDVACGALCSLLKRDPSISFKAKGNPVVSVLTCSLLYSAYTDEDNWPLQFIEVYLEDSLGERVWVDRADCKPFVDNILTAFSTNLTPKNPVNFDSFLHGSVSLPSSAAASSSPSNSPFHTPGSMDTNDGASSSSVFTFGSAALIKDRLRLLQTAVPTVNRNYNESSSVKDLLNTNNPASTSTPVKKRTLSSSEDEVNTLNLDDSHDKTISDVQHKDEDYDMEDSFVNYGASDIAETTEFMNEHSITYQCQGASVKQLVMDVITEQTARRQTADISSSKQLLRLLTNVAGYGTIRMLAVTKLELWLQNPKLMKVAQELLLSVCLNCVGHEPSDKDVIVGLLKLRFKNKQLISHYLICIKELLENDEENVRIALTHTIYNELSATKNQNNMQILSIMFQHHPKQTPKLLADIFMDLLMNKEDYLRALRGLLREIVRTLRHDFTFQDFCVSLMENRSEHPVYVGLDTSIKERILFAITDLVSLCELLTITPAVREAGTSASWSDKRKDAAIMQTFWTQVASIQCSAVVWMSDVFMSMLPKVEGQNFIQCLYKLLMMAKTEHYHNIDHWPAEQDRALVLRLVSETPVLEDTIIQVLMMGMESEYPFKAADALDVVELMINRAASLNAHNYLVLKIENMTIVELLLTISTYRHPDNIRLPDGYEPPHLAIATMYWKSWLLLLVISAYNPSKFGRYVWKEYPTLEMMMEMVMTNTYSFPPISSADNSSSVIAKEKQICELEKQEILVFEGYLARATSNVTITESNSLLLPQLISMNAKGPPRCPPANVINDLKTLNSTLHIGHLLSKSRNPDFLMQVIQKQGTSNAMPWLLELVESNEGSLDILPVQCLCEFLLLGNEDSVKVGDGKVKPVQRLTRQDKLLNRLQAIMHQSSSSESQQAAVEVIEFFFKRLYFPTPDIRRLSIRALQVMFADPITQQAMEIDIDTEINEYEWLTMSIPDLDVYKDVEDLIQDSLLKAFHVELDGDVIGAYLTYLLESRLYRKEPSHTVLELSIMLTQRPSVRKLLFSNSGVVKVLVSAFYDFTVDAIKRPTGFSWPDENLSVVVHWSDETGAVIDLRIIHAVILLLCHKPTQDIYMGEKLLDVWFPSSRELPVGFLSNKPSELLELYTDKQRRSMLQSGTPTLVTAALTDLKINQLLVFVQSFGLAVETVDLLLEHIDKACKDDTKAVKKAIQSNKSYLQQLMDTQRLRGVTKGVAFSSLLKPNEKDDEKTGAVSARPLKPPSSGRTLSMLEQRHIPYMDASVQEFVMKHVIDQEKCTGSFITMQRSILSDRKLQSQVIEVFVEMLEGANKSKLLKSIQSASNAAASLLRLLLSDVKNPKSRELCILLQATIDSLPKLVVSVVTCAIARHRLPKNIPDDCESWINNEMVKMCLDDHVQSATEQCLSRTAATRNCATKESLGLLVDWLEILDPEIVKLSSHEQIRLLFGRDKSSELSTPAGPSYLRTLLTYQTRWSSMKSVMHYLLSIENATNWDSTAVLDFMTVCFNHPRLNQGQQARSYKQNTPEHILNISGKELENLTRFICVEAINKDEKDVSSQRIEILIKVCYHESQLENLVNFLELGSTRPDALGAKYRNVLVLLYSQKPKIIHWLGNSSVLYQDMTSALSGTCVLDSEIHVALSTLGAAKAGKKSIMSMTDANLVCRRLASVHPILFMRHLSTLNSILSGRCMYPFGEFVNQNYLLLYTCVLGIMELLQPHIFIQASFPDLVDAFFSVIKTHGQENDDTMLALFNKVIALLCNFSRCLPDLCARTIIQYKDLLSALQNDSRYNKNSGLKALATASYMPQAKEKMDNNDSLKDLMLQMSGENVIFTHEQLKSTLRKLNVASPTEDMISALNDLDATSKKVVDVLSKCLDEFKQLMFCVNEQVREGTFKLVKRYISHNPRASKEFVTPMITCLENEDANISKTALSYVADFALLMTDDDRRQLMDAAFYVAAMHNDDDGIKNLQEIVRIVSANIFVSN